MTAFRATAGFATLLLASLLSATSARAQGTDPAWRGFYLGGGGSYSTVSVEAGSGCYESYCWWGDYDDYEEGDGSYSYAVHAGYRINPFVAIEVNHLDTATIRWDQNFVYFPEFDGVYNNRVDFEARLTELSLLGILPFAGRWEVYLRAGAGFWDGSSAQQLDEAFGDDVVRRDVEDSGVGFLIGMGLGVTIAESWHLRLDLQSVTLDGDVLNTREDSGLDSMLLEVQYRFGARRAMAQPVGEPVATP